MISSYHPHIIPIFKFLWSSLHFRFRIGMSPANVHVGKSEQYDVEKSNNHSAGNGHCLPPDKDDKSMMTTTTTKDELRYGCFGFLPDRLQWLNNIRFAVLFISLAHCFQNTANGLLGVSLSTMEKRFDLSSSQSSWIASAYEIGQIPTIIVISYFGNRWGSKRLFW